MAFEFFENAIETGMSQPVPNKWYRDLQQAFIKSAWCNTTSVELVGEQDIDLTTNDYYKYFTFTNVEAWVDTVVGQSSTGSKSGRDFVRLVFQDITHPLYEGRYYIVKNEYYISYFDDRVVDVDANLSVRRCNEWMRIIDPLTGALYQIPCVVDYDMTAASNRVTTPIITPNNHATVKVQQNATTNRLFTTNTRFILGNRPFKITGMQNVTKQFINNFEASMMQIDLFLDEIWEQDDLVNGIAYNGDYNYSIDLLGQDMELTTGATGTLYSKVALNGDTVERSVVWFTSNTEVVTIDNEGAYEVVGAVGESAAITVELEGNDEIYDSIIITVVDETAVTGEVVITPVFTFVREYETITFVVEGFYGGGLYTPDVITLTIPEGLSNYLTYTQNDNQISLTCLKRYSDSVELTVSIQCSDPAFTAEKTFSINLTSLLG